MESFILGSECWKSGSLDMEWPILIRWVSILLCTVVIKS
jgi:hypothetical protein